MFPVGPISQAFCAVAIMQLYEEGKIDLDKSIQYYLSEIPDMWKDIRIIDLLHHASGLPHYEDKILFHDVIDALKRRTTSFFTR